MIVTCHKTCFLNSLFRLASLSNFSLLNCCFVDNGKFYPGHCDKVVIGMLYTAFDTLTWARNTIYNIYEKVKNRVDTSSKSYCYIGNEDGSVAELSDDGFYMYWNSRTVLSFLCPMS
jgi:hypothetical protein